MDDDVRIKAIENGILPIMRIAGQDERWPLTERMAHYDVPGVSIAVMRDGEIAWAKGYGLREKDKTGQVDEHTVFMGASTSKPVTGFLVMQMVERGVVSLDVDINRYLKRWQLPQNEFTRDVPVTLRNILNHTAGLTVNGWPVARGGGPCPRCSICWKGGGRRSLIQVPTSLSCRLCVSTKCPTEHGAIPEGAFCWRKWRWKT